MRPLYAILFLFFSLAAIAQMDSIAWSQATPWPDGVFLSYNALKKSKPIIRERIVSTVSSDDPNFIASTLAAKSFSFTKAGETIVIPSAEVWGFMQNNTFHINVGGEFFRVPAFGAICYFGSFHSAPAGKLHLKPGKKKISKEYLLDYYTGGVDYFSLERLEELLRRDERIYNEFKNLGRIRKQEMAYLFIRKFNEAHPVYLRK